MNAIIGFTALAAAHVNQPDQVQILLNLLSNATKFTQNGSTIIVRIIQKPYYKKGYALYEFHVRDNGIGMSREFQEHLFESFTREETSTVSGIQGTGLGMAINVSHMVQEIAMEFLSNAGFSVSLADDGDVAVETLRTAAPDQFDLVLMDIQMPKLDGYSATRQIRTLDSAIAKKRRKSSRLRQIFSCILSGKCARVKVSYFIRGAYFGY